MSDETLRRLERRWRETGAVEDEAALLAALLRAGELSLSIAHRAARLALTLSADEIGIAPSGLFGRVAPEVARWALDRGHL